MDGEVADLTELHITKVANYFKTVGDKPRKLTRRNYRKEIQSYQEDDEGQSDLLLAINFYRGETVKKSNNETVKTVGLVYVCVCACMRALTGRCVQRVVDVVGHPCCKAPVVGAVLKGGQTVKNSVRLPLVAVGVVRGSNRRGFSDLEDVAQRHGSVGETVDKQRLQ